jgi:hypothetical protein
MDDHQESGASTAATDAKHEDETDVDADRSRQGTRESKINAVLVDNVEALFGKEGSQVWTSSCGHVCACVWTWDYISCR